MSNRVELTRRVLQVCTSCPHAKWQGRTMTCDRKKSQYHSSRVRKWLDEIERLEETYEHNRR